MNFQVFTSASTVVFKTFACDNEAVKGKSYLREDYRISCKSSTHTYFMFYSGFMILVSGLRCTAEGASDVPHAPQLFIA